MKRLIILLIVVTICIVGCTFAISAWRARIYTLSDFDHIEVGVSTLYDLHPLGYYDMRVRSFGGICEYPTTNGQYIQIRIGMPGYIVEAINIVDKPQ